MQKNLEIQNIFKICFVKPNDFQIGTCIYMYINSMIKIVLTHQKVLQNWYFKQCSKMVWSTNTVFLKMVLKCEKCPKIALAFISKYQIIFKNGLDIQKISKKLSCHVKKNRIFKNHKKTLHWEKSGFHFIFKPIFQQSVCKSMLFFYIGL